MLAIKPTVLGRARANPPKVTGGAKSFTGLSGCSSRHHQETEAQGTTRKLRPFQGSPLTQGTARQLRTCRTWPRLAWPSPASTPILALLPTLKGTLWGQKVTHCVPGDKGARDRGSRRLGRPHHYHTPPPLCQRRTGGGTLEFLPWI